MSVGAERCTIGRNGGTGLSRYSAAEDTFFCILSFFSKSFSGDAVRPPAGRAGYGDGARAHSSARRGGTPEFAEPRSVIIIIARLIIEKGG